jgi:hypothetical protein
MTIKNKSQLIDYISQYITSNTERRVTPEDIKNSLLDIIDSLHILMSGENILSNNLSTRVINNTSVGEDSMPNVIGVNNTSVGSNSQHCNLLGNNNTSIGTYALENNMSGDSNTSIGVGSLLNLKRGKNNIGVGTYAGYYIGQNDENQLYIGSHDISEDFVSNNPNGHPSVTPLLRGDLSDLILGVGTNDLHEDGTLQVNGNITPSTENSDNTLGTSSYVWDRIYVGEIDSDSNISLNKNIIPGGIVNIGASGDEFNNLHVKNLYVTETATINNVTNTSTINSFNKKIFLSTSGVDPLDNNPKPILTDEGINTGGLYILSSGEGYNREYGLYYTKPNLLLTNLVSDNALSRSHWNSNISISTDVGNHIMTDALRGRESLRLLTNNDTELRITNNGIITGNDQYIQDFVGFSALTYVESPYAEIKSIAIPEQNMFGNYSSRSTIEASIYEDIGYISLNTTYETNGPSGDYFNYIKANNNVVSADTIYLTFIPYLSGAILSDQVITPKGAFNVYLRDNSNVRFSSKTGPSSLELSSSGNDLNYGFKLESDGISTKGSLYYDGNNTDSFSLQSGEFNLETPLRIKRSIEPAAKTGHGTIYVVTGSGNKSESIYFKDGSGNIFDLLSETQPDKYNDAFVFTDNGGNTLIGNNGDRNDFNAIECIVIGQNNVEDYNVEENNIIIGNNLLEFLATPQGNNDVGRLLIGYGGELFVDAKIKDGNNPGYFKVPERLQVRKILDTVSYESTNIKQDLSGKSYLSLLRDGYNEFNLLEFTNIYSFLNPPSFSHVFTNTIPSLGVKGNLNLYGDLRFTDGTSIPTASGIPTVAGNGISIDYDSGTKLTAISLDLSNMDSDNGSNQFGNNSNIIVETDGEVKKTPISQLSQFVNHTNPQIFFQCDVGYNLILSNNTIIDNERIRNTIFIGNQAGDSSQWITNSIFIGPKAGQNAYTSNINLDADISLIAIGHRAGRNSSNCDNSVFIGSSAGQDTDSSDNSVFIGSSAGQFADSDNSIGIGDNALEGVKGSNNLEILPNQSFGKLINGHVSNKANIAGIIAGDICIGRVSVGGASRTYPAASLEVCAKSDDLTVPLQHWYNSNGDLVAYLDQDGNLRLKGEIFEEQIISGNNKKPATMPSIASCGNTNIGASLSPVVITGSTGSTSDFLTYSPQGYMLNYTMIYQEE